MQYKDTIVARATPPGYGGIGILRISGSNSQNVAKEILGNIPKPRYANYLPFKDENNKFLDHGIAIWFPGPNSFTGEDVLELHAHGGPIILDLLLKRILMIPEIRIANPGEFSERAFLNNKIDLTQAEAISDLIHASSEKEVQLALNSLQGSFSFHINLLIKELTQLRMYIETSINFPDEEVSFIQDRKIKEQFKKIITYLDSLYVEAQQGILLREGMRIVIIGRPNSGKSSLFNTLTGQETAIVTNIEGTTRDVLCEHIQIDGIPLYIVDTAGLHNTNDIVERIAISRTWKEIEKSDKILFVVDSSTTLETNPLKIWPEFIERLPKNLPITIVRNKIDITKEIPEIKNIDNKYTLIRLSVYTGDGINLLLHHLKSTTNIDNITESSFLARRRHIKAIEMANDHLKKGQSYLLGILPYEILAEELRLAQLKLSEITGRFTSDDLLSEIFSKFCIGK